jgi:hypothetical protein
MEFITEAKRLQKLAGILREDDTQDPFPPIVPEVPIVPPGTPPAPTPSTPPGIINRDEAKRLIKATKGKFFTVTFVKRTDGTKRVMNARLGVKAYLKGGRLPYEPEPKGLIPVYDMQRRRYRMINLRTITNLKIGNNEYIVR